ncbi:conserved hypothetical protein, secreted [Candidatus Omnitrophus magneticus]|uniref:Uncharacterized protein n=1 Tax=Candidatus Omnitrophus magneticus TaxID=1609969 RepID=A0A0F0CRU6_9BACT|nr:conserved hypothetical protein, secreted [Candidatus Omnitrophus magneticus]
MKIINYFKKFVAIFNIIMFIFFSMPINSFSIDLGVFKETFFTSMEIQKLSTLSSESFILPTDLGTVRYSYNGSSEKIIIHIQDAHCNYSAQHKISDILEYLNTEYGIKNINLEGGRGAYNFAIFTAIPEADIRSRVADYFIKWGELNGAELFAINNPNKVFIWGIEDTDLYLKNLKVFSGSLSYKEEVSKILEEIKTMLNKLKERIFSEELLSFDSKFTAYKRGEMDFKAYLEFLLKKAKERLIQITTYKNIYLISQSLEEEVNINFKKANDEREGLIEKFKGILSEKELKDFIVKTIAFKDKKMSEMDFYEYLTEKARDARVKLDDYPSLQKYIRYTALYKAADKYAISKEMEELENKIKSEIYQNDTQKKLDTLYKNYLLMENMFNFSFTKEDYLYYTANKASFSLDNYINFIKMESPKHGLNFTISPKLGALDGYRSDVFNFYEYSFLRDEVFIKNIKLGGETKKAGVVVTGGFHTENFLELLKKENISYVSIIPNFKSPKGYESPYFKLLAGDKSPFESSLESNVFAIQVASILNQLGIDAGGMSAMERQDVFRMGVLMLERMERNKGIGNEALLLDNGKYLVFGFNEQGQPFMQARDLSTGAEVINAGEKFSLNAIKAVFSEIAQDRDIRNAENRVILDTNSQEIKDAQSLIDSLKNAGLSAEKIGLIQSVFDSLVNQDGNMGIQVIQGLLAAHAGGQGIYMNENGNSLVIMHELLAGIFSGNKSQNMNSDTLAEKVTELLNKGDLNAAVELLNSAERYNINGEKTIWQMTQAERLSIDLGRDYAHIDSSGMLLSKGAKVWNFLNTDVEEVAGDIVGAVKNKSGSKYADSFFDSANIQMESNFSDWINSGQNGKTLSESLKKAEKILGNIITDKKLLNEIYTSIAQYGLNSQRTHGDINTWLNTFDKFMDVLSRTAKDSKIAPEGLKNIIKNTTIADKFLKEARDLKSAAGDSLEKISGMINILTGKGFNYSLSSIMSIEINSQFIVALDTGERLIEQFLNKLKENSSNTKVLKSISNINNILSKITQSTSNYKDVFNNAISNYIEQLTKEIVKDQNGNILFTNIISYSNKTILEEYNSWNANNVPFSLERVNDKGDYTIGYKIQVGNQKFNTVRLFEVNTIIDLLGNTSDKNIDIIKVHSGDKEVEGIIVATQAYRAMAEKLIMDQKRLDIIKNLIVATEAKKGKTIEKTAISDDIALKTYEKSNENTKNNIETKVKSEIEKSVGEINDKTAELMQKDVAKLAEQILADRAAKKSAIGALYDKAGNRIQEGLTSREENNELVLSSVEANLMDEVKVKIMSPEELAKLDIKTPAVSEVKERLSATIKEGHLLTAKELEEIQKIISALDNVSEIKVLAEHKDVMGFFGDNKVLYLNSNLLNDSFSLLHELGEGYIALPQGERYNGLTRHTFMRGVGKDIRIAHDMLVRAIGEGGISRMSESGYLSALIEQLKSANLRDMTLSEKALISYNFDQQNTLSNFGFKITSSSRLYGMQDRIDVTGNAEFTNKVRGLLADVRRGVMNIILMPSENIEIDAKERKLTKDAGKKLGEKDIQTRILTYDSFNLEAQINKSIKEAGSKENQNKFPKIYIHTISKTGAEIPLEIRQAQEGMPNLVAIGSELSDIDLNSLQIDVAKIAVVATVLLNDKRLKEDFGYTDARLEEMRRNSLMTFGSFGYFEGMSADSFKNMDSDELSQFMDKLLKGAISMKITKINYEEIQEWQNAQTEVLKSL